MTFFGLWGANRPGHLKRGRVCSDNFNTVHFHMQIPTDICCEENCAKYCGCAVQYLEIVQAEEEERAAADAAARQAASAAASTSRMGQKGPSGAASGSHAKPQKRLQLGYRCWPVCLVV